MRVFLKTLLIVAFIVLIPTTSWAHPLSASYGTIKIEEEKVEFSFSIDHMSVIENVSADKNADGRLTEEEITQNRESITEWINQHVQIQANDVSQRPLSEAIIRTETKNGKEVVTLTQEYPYVDNATYSVMDTMYYNTDDKTSYTHLLTINQNGKFSEHILKGENRHVDFGLQVGENEANSQSSPAWYAFFLLGMEHILTGYDHLLFLFALLLAKQTFKDYVKVVTAFTVAHSITLTLGYLDIINLPSLLVESIIALSIVYVAIENLFRKNIKKRWLLTFAFGLIHGLGFAGLLSEMTIPSSHFVLSLLSFNLGIEVVQIILVALLIPILARIQQLKYYSSSMKYGSALIIIIGGYWVIERVFQL
ncbi:HupE/UreJ family protein [Metabacillus sp. HB246100]|uniref:HupE/UreJ family protein n=1 Tax=Bacillus weihaiensis TaxID=1547283 RepID=UPI002354A8EE|nr:HupE/UreJ family protein [Bacillus weihaiensis]